MKALGRVGIWTLGLVSWAAGVGWSSGQGLGLGSELSDPAAVSSTPFVDPWVVVTMGRATAEFPVTAGAHALYRISTTASNARTAEIVFTLPKRDGPVPRVVEISFPSGGKLATDVGDTNWTLLTLDGSNSGRLRIRPPLTRGVFVVRIVEFPDRALDLKFRVGTPGEPLQAGESGSLVPYESDGRWE